jgi:predicted dehydrogenase
MSNNISDMMVLENYDFSKLKNKKIAIIGSGFMAENYVLACKKMNINNILVIGNKEEKVKKICKKYKIHGIFGGYEKNLKSLEKMDLVIICIPVHLLVLCTNLAIKYCQKNILIEKPGSIYVNELLNLNKIIKSANVKIGYNRISYPNYQLLKQKTKEDGGITSCTFTFTERIDKIDFNKEKPEVFSRLGIGNSLHVISMVFDLIGMPKKMTSIQKGGFKWHKSGSIFVGSGITKKNIPFSYHADWESSGRWGIEIMTKKNSYKLIPLEELYQRPKGTFEWTKIKIKNKFPNIKHGIPEQIVAMLDQSINEKVNLVTVKLAASLNKEAEKIFGYKY